MKESSFGVEALPPALLDAIDGDESLGAIQTFIDRIRDKMGLKNCIYHCPTLEGFDLANPFIAATHPEDWRAHYVERRYIEIDPAYNLGAQSSLPLDWSSFDRSDRKVLRFFNEAEEAGVGRQGITVPVRGPANGVWALFGVSTDDNDRDWSLRRSELLKNCVLLAHFVHQRAVNATASTKEQFNLQTITPREREALFWAAEGKTLNDIAVIMKISPETVKAHLDSARHRLGALSRTHAVAKALRAGLIR